MAFWRQGTTVGIYANTNSVRAVSCSNPVFFKTIEQQLRDAPRLQCQRQCLSRDVQTTPDKAQGFVATALAGKLGGQRCAHLKLLLGATAPLFDQPTLVVRYNPGKGSLLGSLYRPPREPSLHEIQHSKGSSEIDGCQQYQAVSEN